MGTSKPFGVRTRSAVITSALSAAMAVAAAPSAWAGATANEPLLVDPPVVTARLFYHGQSVRVSGTIPPGHEAAVVISDEGRGPVDLKIKGRIWGVLWANTGEVSLESVPTLYLAAASTDLSALGDAALRDDLAVGYDALEWRSVMSPTGSPDDRHRLFSEFVKLKERGELYAIDEGGIHLEPDASGGSRFSVDFFFPPDVPVGSYDVRLLAFAKGAGTRLASSELTVNQAGLAAWISSLAQERGLLYGLLSVIVALAAGLTTGFVFDLGSKGGH